MHLDLSAALRCPRPHGPSGLVLAADVVRGRHVIAGVLGCPVCDAQFVIRDGVVLFADPPDAASSAVPESMLDVAAMLGLESSGGIVVLGGAWGKHAAGLSQLGEALTVVVNPLGAIDDAEGVSVVHAEGVLPIAVRAARAAAVDAATAAMDGMVAALAPRGRYVASGDVDVPDGVRELARDSAFWVGEAVAPPVTLSRRATR